MLFFLRQAYPIWKTTLILDKSYDKPQICLFWNKSLWSFWIYIQNGLAYTN